MRAHVSGRPLNSPVSGSKPTCTWCSTHGYEIYEINLRKYLKKKVFKNDNCFRNPRRNRTGKIFLADAPLPWSAFCWRLVECRKWLFWGRRIFLRGRREAAFRRRGYRFPFHVPFVRESWSDRVMRTVPANLPRRRRSTAPNQTSPALVGAPRHPNSELMDSSATSRVHYHWTQQQSKQI